jgi:hypothetical protein
VHSEWQESPVIRWTGGAFYCGAGGDRLLVVIAECARLSALKLSKRLRSPRPSCTGLFFCFIEGRVDLANLHSACRSSTSFRDSGAVGLTEHLSKALIHSHLSSPMLSVSNRRPSYRYLRTFSILLSSRNALASSFRVFDLFVLVFLAISLASWHRFGTDPGNLSRTRAGGEGAGPCCAVRDPRSPLRIHELVVRKRLRASLHDDP